MSSFGADGGMVSNAFEIMQFLRKFYKIEIVDLNQFIGFWNWRKIFFQISYDLGQMKFELPKVFTLLKKITLIVHSGMNGSFMFFCPKTNANFTGTINEVNDLSLAFRLMLNLNNSFKQCKQKIFPQILSNKF